MKKTFSFLVLFIIATFVWNELSAQYYYASNESGLLALHERKDLKFSIATGRNSIAGRSLSLNMGYSPFKNIAIQGSYFKFNTEPIQLNKYTKGSLISALAGTYYFFPINKKNKYNPILKDLLMQKGFLMDFYMAYARGNMYNNYINSKAAELFYTKSYLQAGLHWQTGTFGLDFISKFGFLDYYKTEAFFIPNAPASLNIENFGLYDTFNFRENAIRVRLHLKYVGIYLTRTWINHSERGAKFIDNATHFGLIIDIDKISNKKKKNISSIL